MSKPGTILALVEAFAVVVFTAGCASMSFDRSHDLRQFERLRMEAETAALEKDFSKASDLLRSALVYAERLDAGSFRTGATLALLGDSLWHAGQVAEARSTYEKALARLNESAGKSAKGSDRRLLEEETARVLLNLGEVCLKSDDLASAESYYGKAVDLLSAGQEGNVSQAQAESFGRAKAGLALVLSKQGNVLLAKRTLNDALDSPASKWYSHELKDRIVRLCTSMKGGRSNLSNIDDAQSDGAFRQHVLAGREAVKSQNFAQAETQFQLAVEEAQKLGLDSRRQAKMLTSLGNAQEMLGKYDQAYQSVKQALDLKDKSNQPDNPGEHLTTDRLLEKLVVLSQKRGSYDSCYQYASRQLEIRKAANGAGSAEVGEALSRLAEAGLMLGKTQQAKQNAAAAWNIMKDKESGGHPGMSYENLARVNFALGQYSEAAAINDRLLKYSAGRRRQDVRRLMAAYRRAALEAQKGDQAAAQKLSAGTAGDALKTCSTGRDRLELIVSLNQEASVLAAQHQNLGAVVMYEAGLKLPADRGDSQFSQARQDATSALERLKK